MALDHDNGDRARDQQHLCCIKTDHRSVVDRQRRHRANDDADDRKDQHDVDRLAVRLPPHHPRPGKFDQVGNERCRDDQLDAGQGMRGETETVEAEIEDLTEIDRGSRMRVILQAMVGRHQGSDCIATPDWEEIDRQKSQIDRTEP
ncbi:MAG: hypothetical protein GEU95_16095 [Rhizobiales bacterium]|nr:hypothetical protein [Hyphomicrobiales bacterium]